jgi:hypothetical protein
MGRLTLNILLSFAQFERELSSERVRDKIAGSRRKGKWTGGTVPLGYDARDKKLVANKTEAETVRTIFRRYLELRSFSKLVADLDRSGIVTKRRNTKVAKFNGAIPFTYGPLAYFLKNRVYLGEVHHGGKWFDGEHKGIVDRATFDRVQKLLATKSNGRKAKRSKSGALLMGKLYDDRGNLMSPSFSSKNGVRYRFYVSSALLRGRKAAAGSVTRVPAQAVEQVILRTLRARNPESELGDAELLDRHLSRAVLDEHDIRLSLRHPQSGHSIKRGKKPPRDSEIRISWVRSGNSSDSSSQNGTCSSGRPDHKLVQAVVRAHCWTDALVNADFASIEELAASIKLHPKVVRNDIRLAFLAPDITNSILTTGCAFGLPELRKISVLSWQKQLDELNQCTPPRGSRQPPL